MAKHLRACSLLAMLVFVAFSAFSPIRADKNPASKANPVRTGDILSFVAEGKVSLQLTAHGAYRLGMRIKNLTDEPIEIDFPPGLVADAFAQNQILQQLQSSSSSAGGAQPGSGMPPPTPGSSSGSQGMAMLQTSQNKADAGQVLQLTFRTACMNFGVPEPKPTSRLFLKRVEDYTPNPELQIALKQIAKQRVETPIAQAAIWHLSNNLSWETLGNPRMTAAFNMSPMQVKKAESFLTKALDDASKNTDIIAGTEVGKTEKPPYFAFDINPDPRGGTDSAALVSQAVQHLKELHPRIAFSHANYPNPPPEAEKPFVQWGALVQTQPASKAQTGSLAVQFTFAKSTWNPSREGWRHDPPTTSSLTFDAASANPRYLAERLLAELGSRAVTVTYSGDNPRKLRLANGLPMPIQSLTVHDAQKPKLALKLDVGIPAGGESEVILDEEQAKQLARAGTLVAGEFEIQK
jgi:hypothetical protein